MRQIMKAEEKSTWQFHLEIAGLDRAIVVKDIDPVQIKKRDGSLEVDLFSIVENFLDKRYVVLSIRRKFVPIFWFKGEQINPNLFKYPQKVSQKDSPQREEGQMTPFYFLVYLKT